MAAVELFVTLYEHVWAHSNSMSPEVACQFQAYIRSVAASPAFRAYLEDRPADWFLPGFVRYLGYDVETV